jgi:plasmid stabilization system protein ParE
VKRRRVRLTETAREQLRAIRAWWKENATRPAILAKDIAEAFSLLAVLPSVGAPYEHSRIGDLRRLHLRKLSSHVYYTFDETEVIVHAIWHTSRKRQPPIRG